MDDFHGGLGRIDVEVHAYDSAFVVSMLDEPGVAKHVTHAAVSGQRVGDEPVDAPGTGKGGQVLEQQCAQSPPLMGIVDHKGDLGLVVGDVLVAGHGDDLVVEDAYQGHAPIMVHMGEMFDLVRSEVGVVREVPQVNRLVGQPSVKGQQRRPILRRDRANMHGAAVGEHGVCGAPTWVAESGHADSVGRFGRRGQGRSALTHRRSRVVVLGECLLDHIDAGEMDGSARTLGQKLT